MNIVNNISIRLLWIQILFIWLTSIASASQGDAWSSPEYGTGTIVPVVSADCSGNLAIPRPLQGDANSSLCQDGSATTIYAFLGDCLSSTQGENLECLYVKKSGQTTSYLADGSVESDPSVQLYDDGYYQKGLDVNYTRDDVNDTVVDNITGLMWQDNPEVNVTTSQWLDDMTYAECQNDEEVCSDTSSIITATSYCDALILDGYDDWRLPSLYELTSILWYSSAGDAIDTSYFKNHASDKYWSSTSYKRDETSAWYVNFNTGHIDNMFKNSAYYVRCVREEKK